MGKTGKEIKGIIILFQRVVNRSRELPMRESKSKVQPEHNS